MIKMRPIRSYMRRQGRMSADQKQALEKLWDYYCITGDEVNDLYSVFLRGAPNHLEIGFGMGDALLEMAQAHPENNYLGIEVHQPGVGQLLLRMHEENITNIRIVCNDANEIMDFLPASSLAEIYVFFPDPWEKIRHHKRRLIQGSFVLKLQKVIEPGGFLHVVTDCGEYAEYILSSVEENDGFSNVAGNGNYIPRPKARPLTRYEKRCIKKGTAHEVKDLLFKKI